jgi:hypothetical protein
MKRTFCFVIVMAGSLALAVNARAGGDGRLGVGAHYWTTVKNIDVHNVDEHGYSWLATCQYWPSLIGLEADVEWFQSGYAGADQETYEPQAYLLVGSGIYGAAGIGGYYWDGEWGDRPFYALRGGLNFELLPSLYLDVNANYRFEDWAGLKASDIDSDTITLGAAVRLAF